MNIDEDCAGEIDIDSLQDEDKWLISQYNRLIPEVRDNLDRYELGIGLSKLYDFTWDIYCDWYIELVKGRLSDKSDPSNKSAQNTLTHVLTGILLLLHPFMPFVTEEIWQSLPNTTGSIMLGSYPVSQKNWDFPVQEEGLRLIIDTIRAIRNRRAEMNVPPSRKALLYILPQKADVYEGKENFFVKLAGAQEVLYVSSPPEGNNIHIITEGARVFIPQSDIVDTEAERIRLQKEQLVAKQEMERADKKLSNPQFTSKAPEPIIAEQREKYNKYKDLYDKVTKALTEL